MVRSALRLILARRLQSSARTAGTWAYATQNGKKWVVVLDGKPGPPFPDIQVSSLVFSANGMRFAYVADKGNKEVAVIDGQVGSDFDLIVGPAFSADSAHVAYTALTHKSEWQVAVVDGRIGPEVTVQVPASILLDKSSRIV